MNGYEFELFTADLFRKMGYTVKLTKQTGDQGIDVIAVKNRTSLGVQVSAILIRFLIRQ
ncbi:restriction endonuclease [Cytobacillus praedii]|uniref:restriction endonuclease n=1 Tax=Cytobacillus praedii TaxID=1742358 RepID=UPI002E218118|nr:restriction endonuclease [Cytobacillus praedii]